MGTNYDRPFGSLADERGFTLIELLVATVVSMLVLGGAVVLTSQVQNGYRRQIEQAAAEQEARYALEWIGKLIRGADNNPFNVTTTDCPAAGTGYAAIRFDPNGDGVDNDIRLQTDSNPPDGQVGGTLGVCTQANEDVTISLDTANSAILFFDNNLGVPASIRTDAVIQDLRFIYRDDQHAVDFPLGSGTPITSANVRYVEIQITARTRTLDPSTGAPVSRTLSSEIRVRSR